MAERRPTPAVISAIQDLKARGFAVTFYPFIAMDVAAGNSLPNPYGGTGQPPYPWRGRITCDPAPGEVGTVDKTATCATQVAAFVGTAAPGDFAIDGDEVTYSGPDEWSFRRFILHCAHLCEAAGGVDAFIMGSELIGATTLRSSASAFPFVTALVEPRRRREDRALAGHQAHLWRELDRAPGLCAAGRLGRRLFPPRPALGVSADIDAVGIDVYWPLSDWRDGEDHLDFEPGRDHLRPRLSARQCPRRRGLRFLLSRRRRDRQRGEPGAHRANPHGRSPTAPMASLGCTSRRRSKSGGRTSTINRPAGVESGSPTAWVPQSKPIWFTELGCPAVDKGSNQPNVFIDPKSSESFAPFFSRVTRDDLMQRRYIQALRASSITDDPDYIAGSNPTSVGL